MRKTAMTIAVLTALGVMLLAAPAFATDGNTIPHGGFSTASDACLQCHDIHESAGDYVLMRQSTMTATCATCHTIYLAGPTGAYDPGYSGTEAGTAAGSQAYRTAAATALTHQGHRLGLGAGTYTFSDGVTADGSYIPGGTSGLTAISYLSYPAVTSALTYTATDGLSCASCHAPHGSFGNLLDPSVSTALLTSRPNHGAEVTITDWVDEGGQWCGGCHDKRMPGAGEPPHDAFSATDCLSSGCHGAGQVDFPHTGTSDLAP